MSVTLRQVRTPDQHIDLRDVLPDRVCSQSHADIRRLTLPIGNRRHTLGELFDVEVHDEDADTLIVVPTDGRIDRIGAGMQGGRLIVRGHAGDLTGAAMSAGSIVVEGNAGDSSGAGMSGGELLINGDAGDRTGSPLAGERRGQQGGLIRVSGSTGAYAGERMRRGLLLVAGDCAECLGYRMIAGTIYCGGQSGGLTGYGMRRGTLLLGRSPQGLPTTIAANGRQDLAFLPLLLREIAGRLRDGPGPDVSTRLVQRFVGDLACDGRGEILVLS